MKQITRDTLSQIMSKPLFGNVGKLYSQRVLSIGSWHAAYEACRKDEYNNIRHSATNVLSLAMHNTAKDVYNKTWNDNVDEIKSLLTDFIDFQVTSLDLLATINERITTTVRGDLLFLGMEAEYSEFVKPGFFAGLSYWYDQGHFPCGWQGEYPQGKLMVY